ncbi:355_t:CDS:2 [Paraglomus occultum]|uniref:355_t:CDS:1 n=1 Tax=Paraglomus occultum TaxID=144539 RepID=A0A9N9A9R7_9GLOM|nr:355_t:CDS:2 [Paraglomus occultum]
MTGWLTDNRRRDAYFGGKLKALKSDRKLYEANKQSSEAINNDKSNIVRTIDDDNELIEIINNFNQKHRQI